MLRTASVTVSKIACTFGSIVVGLASPSSIASVREDPSKTLARLADLPAAEQCAGLESLIATQGLDEASRRTALTRIRDLALEAAAPISPTESKLIEELKANSPTTFERVVEPIVSRYVILLGSETFVANAKAGQVPGLLDATYVVQRLLFAVDPVATVGHRFVFYPQQSKPYGWTTFWDSLTVVYGRADAERGFYDELMAHEMSHAFTARHPAKHLFSAGFGEGWSDLAIAYTGERLGFLGGALEKTWDNWRDGILSAGQVEYLGARLPIEEIIAYGPSVSVVMRLVLDEPAATRWEPLAKLFREGVESVPPTLPAYTWPARFARDMLRAFPRDSTADTLSGWRFPLDAGSRKELDALLARAEHEPAPPLRERWKADAQHVVESWRVLGPIPVPPGRRPTLDFDPGNAWNFVERDELEFRDAKYAWRTDVPITEQSGVVSLGALPDAGQACVFYLRADLPPEAEGPVTFYISSDDECAVWLDGTLVHAFRGNRGTNPEDPDRAYGIAAKGGGRLLVQVANHGGPAGFHLRWSRGTPFETSLRTELRVPDGRRHLAAVRRFGSVRVPFDLVLPLYETALGDSDPRVRAESAWYLAGRRNEPRAIEKLLARWTREKDAGVSAALRGALSELALKDLPDSAAAHRWWRDEGRAWREVDRVEAELAYARASIIGGFYGNNSGCYGGQHIGRCFGGDPSHVMSVMLQAQRSGPHSLGVRYAAGEGERKFDVRLFLGEAPVAGRFGAAVPATASWIDWQWQDVPLGVLPAGCYRVEIGNLDGCLDLDVLALRPTAR